MDKDLNKSVIKRASSATKIERAPVTTEKIRDDNETAAAARMGGKPHEVKSLYRDIYESYQNNEY